MISHLMSPVLFLESDGLYMWRSGLSVRTSEYINFNSFGRHLHRWEVVAKVVGADPYSDVAVLKAERAAPSYI